MLNNNNSSKALILMLVLCFFSTFAFSQTVYSNKEAQSVGFTIGLTSSDIYRDTINYEPGIFLNAGFTYTISLSEKSNLGLELLYSRNAVKRSKPIAKYFFDYVEIPFYYQQKISDNFRLNLGIKYSNFISSTYDTLDGEKSTGVHVQPLKTKMGNDFGILAGIEFGITKNLFAAARYTISAKSFTEDKSPYMGIFQLSFKYVVFRGYQQIFNKKIETAAEF